MAKPPDIGVGAAVPGECRAERHSMRIEGLDQATGLAYAHERDTSLYVDGLHAHRYRLQALHGDWTGAEAGLPSSSPTSTPSAPAVRAPRSPSRLRRA